MAAVAVVFAVGCTGRQSPTREVVVVARGMTFLLENGNGEGNPPLAFRAGERVRLVLKNESPGLLHDFEIAGWNVAIDQLRAGERAEITFTVPATVGRFEYRCRPHSEMMSGVIEVTR